MFEIDRLAQRFERLSFGLKLLALVAYGLLWGALAYLAF